MEWTEIAYEVDDGVATITLDRPDRMNAFTTVMQRELIDAFDEVDADDDVRAVIVTGRGRAFCAGADLGSGGDDLRRRRARRPPPSTRRPATAAGSSPSGSSSAPSR